MAGKNYNYYILSILVLFQGASGIVGGTGLIIDPSGELLNIPITWLKGSPFPDYLIPGIILASILGIYPLIAFIGLLRRHDWAVTATRNLGFALIIWIATEIIVIGYQAEPPLQLIYGILGLIILLISYFPKLNADKMDR